MIKVCGQRTGKRYPGTSVLWVSPVVTAPDCQCQNDNGPGFDPRILRHSGIRGVADEAGLNKVHKKQVSLFKLWQPLLHPTVHRQPMREPAPLALFFFLLSLSLLSLVLTLIIPGTWDSMMTVSTASSSRMVVCLCCRTSLSPSTMLTRTFQQGNQYHKSIPDPGSNNNTKSGGGKFFGCPTIFWSHKYHKNVNNFILEQVKKFFHPEH